MKKSRLLGFMLMLAGTTLSAQTYVYNIIYTFTNYAEGLQPATALICNNNILYGTTSYGGTAHGTVFKIKTDGSDFSVIASGTGPLSGLTLNGNTLYGEDGSDLFRTYTDATNYTRRGFFGGGSPDFVLKGDNLIGLTYGQIVKYSIDNTSFTVLHNFSNSPDGATPRAGLILNGNTLYGTTCYGGSTGNGTIFKIDLDGTGYAILYNFTNISDGYYPQAKLVLNNDTLYGTTRYGGSSGAGTVFAIKTNGTDYAIVRSFTNLPDGANPQAGLLLVGNTLFGTTYNGGSSRNGTVFKINTDGSGYAILRNFLGYNYKDGANPAAPLVAGSDGLYGTTLYGGTGNGTIFRLKLPSSPLQITTAGGSPAVFWQNDGFQHALQTITNLQSGNWTTVSNGVPVTGLQVTGISNQPQAFFRLQ